MVQVPGHSAHDETVEKETHDFADVLRELGALGEVGKRAVDAPGRDETRDAL